MRLIAAEIKGPAMPAVDGLLHHTDWVRVADPDSQSTQDVRLPVPSTAGNLHLLPEPDWVDVPLVNPDFDDGLDGWQPYGGAWSWEHGCAHLDAAVAAATQPGDILSQPVRLELGLHRLRYRIRLYELSSPNEGGLRLHVGYRTAAGRYGRYAGPVLSGTQDWQEIIVPFEFAAESALADSLLLALQQYRTLEPTGGAWIDWVRLERAVIPCSAFLRQPNFRGYSFADEPGVSVRVRNTNALQLEVAKELGEIVERANLEPGDRDVLLDGQEWQFGGHTLGMPDHPDVHLTKLPSVQRNSFPVRFNDDNVLLLHGQPTLPLGMYVTSGFSDRPSYYLDHHLTEMAAAGVNCVINYHQGEAPRQAWTAYLEAMRQVGVYYMVTTMPFHLGLYRKGRPLLKELMDLEEITTQEQMDEFLTLYASEIGAHDNTLGFYTSDERTLSELPDHFHKYRVLSNASPRKPTLIVSNEPGTIKHWKDAADIIMTNAYPFLGMAADYPMSEVGNWVRSAVEATHGARPVWCLMQFFGGFAADRWPRQDELRIMAIMAAVEGARGFWWWSYGRLLWVQDPEERAEYWGRLTPLLAELRAKQDVLLAPDDRDGVSCDNPSVHWISRVAGDERHVLCYLPAARLSEREATPAVPITFSCGGRQHTVALRPDEADWFVI